MRSRTRSEGTFLALERSWQVQKEGVKLSQRRSGRKKGLEVPIQDLASIAAVKINQETDRDQS